MYTRAKDSAKNTTPKTAVTFCINASNPRGFCLLNNSVAPPDKAEDALSVLAGCIKTAIRSALKRSAIVLRVYCTI